MSDLEISELGEVTLFGVHPAKTSDDQAIVSRFDDGLVHLCAFAHTGEGACVVIKADELIEAVRLVMNPT